MINTKTWVTSADEWPALEADKEITLGEVAEVLFRSVSNPLALRKRYRDLVKIFHPDNLFGDEELAQQINKEFMRRRREE